MKLDDFYVVVVTGTREWKDSKRFLTPLRRKLRDLKNEHGSKLLVVSGEADGVDFQARRICEHYGIWFCGVPAPWKLFTRGQGGPVRNAFMLDIFQPDLVIACHPDLKSSKGTKNCVEQAKAKSIPVLKLKPIR